MLGWLNESKRQNRSAFHDLASYANIYPSVVLIDHERFSIAGNGRRRAGFHVGPSEPPDRSMPESFEVPEKIPDGCWLQLLPPLRSLTRNDQGGDTKPLEAPSNGVRATR